MSIDQIPPTESSSDSATDRDRNRVRPSDLSQFARGDLARNLMMLESLYESLTQHDEYEGQSLASKGGACASYVVAWWRKYSERLGPNVASTILLEVARLVRPELIANAAAHSSFGLTEQMSATLKAASQMPIAGKKKAALIKQWVPARRVPPSPLDTVVESLTEATKSGLMSDSAKYAYNVGRVAGIAHSIGLQRMFDALSTSYETRSGLPIEQIRGWLTEADIADPSRYRRGWGGWDEPFVAIREAIHSHKDGDRERYHLMMGVVTGIMFSDPGPDYEFGTILDKINLGYHTSEIAEVEFASQRLAAGIGLTDPSPLLTKDAAVRHFERRDEACRRIQNFGLQAAREGDKRVWIEPITGLNRQIVLGKIDPLSLTG